MSDEPLEAPSLCNLSVKRHPSTTLVYPTFLSSTLKRHALARASPLAASAALAATAHEHVA